ncbi:MAG: SDR family oxidoreductase [Hyphomicrobiaceae bacterium]|nr:SDR family oxidoreductase [Hyphomicrobiaceae bacterium]
MATITIIGASRGIGLEAVKRALALGHHVRALARSPRPADLDHAELEWIQGDATVANDLVRATRGADAVIQTLGVANPFSFRPVTLFSRSTRQLVDVMEQHGPARLITVTGFGAGDSRGKGSIIYEKLFFPLILSRIYEDKDVQEQMIRNSRLDWTIVRPGILTNGRRTGRVIAEAAPEKWRLGAISRADVADFLVEQVAGRSFLHKTPVLWS